MEEKHVIEELENIAANSPVYPCDMISPRAVHECERRGWTARDSEGRAILAPFGAAVLDGSRPAEDWAPDIPRSLLLTQARKTAAALSSGHHKHAAAAISELLPLAERAGLIPMHVNQLREFAADIDGARVALQAITFNPFLGC